MPGVTGSFVLIGFIFIGFGLFWARQLVYRMRPASDEITRLVMSIAAAVCIAVGIGGGLLHSLHMLSVVGLVITVGVALMLVTRYRAIERRALLRCISVALQKGIGLNEATRAFARERSDELGVRAAKLAQSLEAGMMLPDALHHSGTRLPVDALLAVRVGYETGTLDESLRRISRVDADLDMLVRSIYEKLLYLTWIFATVGIIVILLMLKIVPVFEPMFSDFGVRLPEATSLLIAGSAWFNEYWFLVAPFIFGAAFAVLLGSLYYVDLLPRGAPVVNRLTRRWDAALVLRTLALAVARGWPLHKTVWLLARVYPSRPVRKRLARAGTHINNGVEWSESLRRAGLLRRTDEALLSAALRVGNVEWALEEIADSSVRRIMYRLRVIVNVLFPLTVLFAGVVIGFVVISLFLPLITLIEEMV